MYLSQRLFSFKTRAPESMHAVQQGFFPAQTQCLMMYSLKYYVKDWALDEGRETCDQLCQEKGQGVSLTKFCARLFSPRMLL